MEYSIGLDLGGTNSVFGIVDSQGVIVEQASMKTKGYENANAYVDAAMKCLAPIIEKVGGIGKVGYMGIGAPHGAIMSGSVVVATNTS